ncbi:hypothetical protein CH380_19335 [Leptospira adleri]|uniref:Uncharacterized protein n=1 Tax=Leptospira adleri TaxID=2023186 RepID=A0A2M9YJ81_9LEPT|nr:hypothetical protein CH380_19335 [Leptospira adleri]PJZ61890.1 hypothetical protein CH376_10830 [Leptospira adleri]
MNNFKEGFDNGIIFFVGIGFIFQGLLGKSNTIDIINTLWFPEHFSLPIGIGLLCIVMLHSKYYGND